MYVNIWSCPGRIGEKKTTRMEKKKSTSVVQGQLERNTPSWECLKFMGKKKRGEKEKIDQLENSFGTTAKCLYAFVNPLTLNTDFLCGGYSIKLVRSAYATQKQEVLYQAKITCRDVFSLYQ